MRTTVSSNSSPTDPLFISTSQKRWSEVQNFIVKNEENKVGKFIDENKVVKLKSPVTSENEVTPRKSLLLKLYKLNGEVNNNNNLLRIKIRAFIVK